MAITGIELQSRRQMETTESENKINGMAYITYLNCCVHRCFFKCQIAVYFFLMCTLNFQIWVNITLRLWCLFVFSYYQGVTSNKRHKKHTKREMSNLGMKLFVEFVQKGFILCRAAEILQYNYADNQILDLSGCISVF